MAREREAIRRPSAKVLEAIREGLGEIDAYFGFSGVSTKRIEQEGEKESAEDDAPRADSSESDGDDDYGNDDYATEYIDREEIEVAIDAFLSALLEAKVISKNKSGKLPTFGDVFVKLFGQDHEITAKAQSFEDYIKGYFGWVSPEDMQSALEKFSDIQEIVQEAAKGGPDAG